MYNIKLLYNMVGCLQVQQHTITWWQRRDNPGKTAQALLSKRPWYRSISMKQAPQIWQNKCARKSSIRRYHRTLVWIWRNASHTWTGPARNCLRHKLFKQKCQLYVGVKDVKKAKQVDHILLLSGEEGLKCFNSWTLNRHRKKLSWSHMEKIRTTNQT